MTLLSKDYFWPGIEKDVKAYVETCMICQQDKIERRCLARLLQLLPIPEVPWHTITFDFITSLPRNREFDVILVIMDKLTKYKIFVPTNKHCLAEEAA